MSEEKKRVRPTAAQVRVLEESLAGLKDVIERKDDHIRKLESEVKKLSSEKEGLLCKVATLEASNESMDGELKRNNNRYEKETKRWKEKAIEFETELMRLKSRGFWSRLFNL